MWDLSCPDWASRIRDGRPLVPDLPLITEEAELGLAIFDELCLPDVPGMPKLGDAAGPWFRDIVRAAFGSWNPSLRQRFIRDIFCLAPKGQSKTSYSAGLMVTAMLMNKRPRGEALFVGPTQAISDRAYEQAVGMIEASAELKRRFRPRDHIKTIEDLMNGSAMKVKTFDVNILTGSILFLVMLDELHLLGKNAHTTKVLRQIRGGLEKTPEGLLLITSTQSDEPPAGAFRDELTMARRIREGAFRGQVVRSMLPVLYEFPAEIARAPSNAGDPAPWEDPSLWRMVMPNLGRSVQLESLIADWSTEREKGDHAKSIWASQHLNIEIGIGLRSDGWAGATYWERGATRGLTLDALLERCEVIIMAADGGGLDDLFGLAAIGRERGTRHWLHWGHAFISPEGLERRKASAVSYGGFIADGDLTVVNGLPDDVAEIIAVTERVKEAGLLGGFGVDPAGYGGLVDALAEIGVTEESGLLKGVPQGIRLMNAAKTVERKLVDGTFKHGGSRLMAWSAGNAKVRQTSTAMLIERAASGFGKIDPLMAAFNAAALMSLNPEALGPSVYETERPDGFIFI